MPHFIAPSILTTDFTDLNSTIEIINNSEADYLHLDIMDGVFVPNLTFGPPVIASIKQKCRKPLDVHLMIVQPERYITEFQIAGADILTVHYEASLHLHRTIQAIKSHGMKAGVALNPHTPSHLLHPILCDLDLVLLMSVNPGFGGQKFIQSSYRKIEELKNYISKENLQILIEVDGGINVENASALFDAGADILVAGNAVFSHPDPAGAISRLKIR